MLRSCRNSTIDLILFDLFVLETLLVHAARNQLEMFAVVVLLVSQGQDTNGKLKDLEVGDAGVVLEDPLLLGTSFREQRA